jgi:23S rRNA (uracil1939-C5)-methyltransferase
MTEKMNDLTFKVSPLAFYQTNAKQALKLYEATARLADVKRSQTVYDLYTGTGTIALFVAKNARKVVGIEYVASAIENARENADLNNISNADFFVGDMAKIFTDSFIEENGKPDVIIADPPRMGMHPKVAEQILTISPERIVYVSCNPATQARDIALLTEKYKVTAVQPVDMFPHTHHVENIALLERTSEA